MTKRKAAVLDANITQQRRSVIVDPSDEDQATLQSAQTLRIDRVRDEDGKERELTMSTDGDPKCDDALLNATVDRVSVDRSTSVPNGDVSSLQLEAVPEGGNVEDASVKLEDRKGFQYKFGFDVKKRDYYYYDSTTRQDSPAKFVEEKEVGGVKTYHFVADVPETDLSNLPSPTGDAPLGTILNMPARWWGISGRGVKSRDMIQMHRYGSAKRHVYVEPTTGTIVSGYEEQHQYFRSPDDSEDSPAAIRDFRMDALKATFQWTDETVANQADRAKGYKSQLFWGGTVTPIILGILGALLLIGWAVITWFGRRGDADDGQDPDDAHGPDDGPYGDGPYDGDPYNGGPDARHDGFVATPHEAPNDAYAYGNETTTSIPPQGSTDDTTVIPPVDGGSPLDDTDTSAFRPPNHRYE